MQSEEVLFANEVDNEGAGAHEHLLRQMSAMLIQVSALQALLRSETSPTAAETQELRQGLAEIERMAREVLHHIRSEDESLPLPELVGVSLTEALTRAVEETAESADLSSRIVFSGEERGLPGYAERLLYRIAQEALYEIQQRSQHFQRAQGDNARKLRFTFIYGRDEAQMNIEDSLPPPGTDTGSDTKELLPIPPFGHENAAIPFSAPRDTPANTLSPILNDLRQRIEHIGGSLELSRPERQGTRLRVRVPYAPHDITVPFIAPAPVPETAVPVTAATPSTRTASAASPVRVLIVDSQAVIRAGLRRLLESYPDLQVVGEAADGVQAVSETLELGPQVVLMDAQLPNEQSLEALRQIKQLNLDTHVLLLATQDREAYLYETLRAGADGYVLKDIAPDELASAVRVVARGEVLVQPQLAGRLLSRFGKQPRGSAPFETLTARELEVLRLLARGLRNKEIASRLVVSERTVNFHLANIYQKLNVSGRTEALSKALEQGLIAAP
ncbi:MAG TPA: response regulator [Ktedonobacteraceae bacterium]|nr:response regulator [Ktedonobacteraceae bacterium]